MLAVDPHRPSTILAGFEFGGVLRSVDAGEDWTFNPMHSEQFLDGPQLTSLAFGPGHKPSLWAGSRLQGVFSSGADAGKWTYRGLRGQWVDLVVPDTRDSSVIYASGTRLWRSTDGGKHWPPMPGLPAAASLASPAPRGTLYAWMRRTVYSSSDQGATWARLPPLPSAQ